MDLILLIFELNHNLLQNAGKLARKMTILEQNPAAVLTFALNQILGLLRLTLTQRNRLQLLQETSFFGEFEKSVCWISTCRQNED